MDQHTRTQLGNIRTKEKDRVPLGQQARVRSGAGNEAASDEETTITGNRSGITGSRQKDKRKPRRSRTRMGYKQQLKPIFERIAGIFGVCVNGTNGGS